ncbi:hypothetical protein Hydth_1647 [Hydrogenobacter thermophilus TK-6]|uniref:Uncharacterized protein n=1 Tax=Hydrogenobacter thermophilus (strain DSM 6534 / IAM 12695 / TK-6) TaxID=608538 RepID=D3DJV6_HYDTT|nr:hypothetical protein [Hydrogenobacter thermophilus]ADO46030.1 hypothetical protein Hydth_1647 [Hydrogenobacter thermophilus TK-6]BAI70108.1 hypothetical protein HTH_1661 [Hydrogenobacter thermophilus TK-6]
MEWVQALTVIASLTAVIGIVANLLNKRIDDLRQDMDRRLDRLEQDIREIRQLLYKAFEAPHREEK